MSGDDGVARRSKSIKGNNQGEGFPREEPFRNYGGWHCPRCNSTNTLIEGYGSGPEGYCMSCARTIPIPEENMNVYRRTHPLRQPCCPLSVR